MRKIFIVDHNNVCIDLRDSYLMANSVSDSDVIVLWQDVIGIEKGTAELAKMMKKPTVVLQHGRNATIDYKNYPLTADKICVWSQSDVDRMKGFGIPKNRVALTGTMVLSHLKPRSKHEGVNVVFRPIHWDTYYVEENIVLRDALRRIKGINVITKTMEAHKPEDFDNPVYSYRDEAGHLNKCSEVLSTADIVVGAGEDGTFEMMAYAMDIPVVIADIWKPKTFLGRPPQEAFYTKACEVVPLDKLEEAIWQNLKNPSKLKKERADVALNEGGFGLSTYPKDEITKVINSL